MGSARGTVDFVFKDQKLSLRPDMEAIEEIEEIIDGPILKIALSCADGLGIRFKWAKAVIYAGLRGHYRNMDKEHLAPHIDEVGEELHRIGINHKDIASSVTKFLTNAISTPDEIHSQNNEIKKKD